MSGSWQTIEQAAVTLRLSVRTINRHIAAGKLESRLNEGRREVRVNVNEPPAEISDSMPDNSAVLPSGSSIDAETVLALADNAAEKAEMAVTAYQTLARVADMQVRQARRGSRVAWAAVVLMAAGVTGAVGWTTRQVTRAAGEIEHLQSQVASSADAGRELSARVDKATAEKMSLEKEWITELTFAREQAARAEGQLAAYKEQETARQTREALMASAKVVAPSPTTQSVALRSKVAEPSTRPSRSTRASDEASASTSQRSEE